jgi:type IV pilus assembly protein PilV
MLLAHEMADKMRANPEQFGPASSPFLKVNFQAAKDSVPASGGCFNTDCNPSQLAAADIAEWLENISSRLPNGRAKICLDDEPWNEQSQSYAWDCKSSGEQSSVVIKLGWADKTDQSQIAAPKIVIPVGHASVWYQ